MLSRLKNIPPPSLRSVETPKAPIPLFFLGFCLLLLGIQLAMEFLAPQARGAIYTRYGLSESGVFSQHRAYQLFTYGFLHGGFLHVGLNAIMIFMLGRRLLWISDWQWSILALSGGSLLGGFFHLFSATGDIEIILVGVSGGAIAMLFVMIALSPEGTSWPLKISGKNLGRGIFLSILILFLIKPALNLPGFSEIGKYLVRAGFAAVFTISHSCHLGGAIFGMILGKILTRERVSLATLQRQRLLNEQKLAARNSREI